MYIDLKRIASETGRTFDNEEQLYFYIKYVVEFLKVNNRNYTKKQREKIDELFSFVQAVKFDNEGVN